MTHTTLLRAIYRVLADITTADFDTWLKKQYPNEENPIKDFAHYYGFWQAEDFEDQYGDKIDKDDFVNDEGELDEYDYLDAWLEYFKEDRSSAFYDWQNKYKKLPSIIPLYRGLRLNNIEKLDKKNIGVYWSDNPDAAYSYAEGRGNLFTIKAKVPKNLIDWDFTIYNNLNPTLGEQEQEINIKENSNIDIVDVQDSNGNWLGISFKGNVGKMGGKSLVASAKERLDPSAFQVPNRDDYSGYVDMPNQPPKVLFHVTHKKNLSNIKKKGLIPKVGEITRSAHGDEKHAATPMVYLADFVAPILQTFGKDGIIITVDPKINDIWFFTGNELVEIRDNMWGNIIEEGDFPIGIEPGDYFSEAKVTPKEYYDYRGIKLKIT